MNQFISYEKLSKKEKRKIDLSKRRGFGIVNPATRVVCDKKKERSRRICREKY